MYISKAKALDSKSRLESFAIALVFGIFIVMEKHTNLYQCPPSSYEQLLLESQSKKKPHEIKKKPLFTFIAFLIVLAIFGFLVALVVLSLSCRLPYIPKDVTLAQISNIDSSIGQYLLDMRQYPQMLEELVENKKNSPNWNGPYLKKSQLKDVWGNPFQYRYPGHHQDYELYSYGADGQPGGEGDNADIGWESIK